MSELTNHGTGWSESEVLMDVVEVYNSWSGDDSPNFTAVQRRLAEKFNDAELDTLEMIVQTLHTFIAAEATRRAITKVESAQEQELQR